MKKKLIVLFTIFALFDGLAQKENTKANNDVIILTYEDYNNNRTKKEGVYSITKNKDKKSYWYLFYFNKVDNIRLWYKEYENFDEMEKDNPVLYLKVHKNFLRKNKDIILTQKKMLKLGYKKTSKLLDDAKTILLVDKNEIENCKIVLKEVTYMPSIEI